mgnify:CR=1 FL=1
MTQASAWLLSEGIEFRWEPGEWPGAWGLDIPASNSQKVSESLTEMLEEDQRLKRHPVAEWVPLLLQPPFAFSLCFAGLLCCLFYYAGGYALQSEIFRLGLFSREAVVEAGQWWRFITGATLHADWGHVLGNGAFIMVLGWAVSERVGVGITAISWLVTAVAGFVVSLIFSDMMISVGASGGLFGLLGVAGGHGFRESQKEVLWFRRIRELGAACSLLAFTAFSAKANIAAHLGGFGAGVVIGFLCARLSLKAVAQSIAMLATFVSIAGGWYLALVAR